MAWHIEPNVDQAIIRLCDALCSWERATGRRSTLVLIPEMRDEELFIANDGKPLPPDEISPELAVANAMEMRRKSSDP